MPLRSGRVFDIRLFFVQEKRRITLSDSPDWALGSDCVLASRGSYVISDRFISEFEESSESLFGLCLFGLIIHVLSPKL